MAPLAYDSPWHYNNLTEEKQVTIDCLEGDFCTIPYEDQTDRFPLVGVITNKPYCGAN
ncbi:hypothetical protein [Rufibacter immobilis]|uniref:hypothetical protein n=1 Tax=Rufibacter immobilis TaxID=1348778 RepID=UPI0035EF2A14